MNALEVQETSISNSYLDIIKFIGEDSNRQGMRLECFTPKLKFNIN
jgi:hypothetical protein